MPAPQILPEFWGKPKLFHLTNHALNGNLYSKKYIQFTSIVWCLLYNIANIDAALQNGLCLWKKEYATCFLLNLLYLQSVSWAYNIMVWHLKVDFWGFFLSFFFCMVVVVMVLGDFFVCFLIQGTVPPHFEWRLFFTTARKETFVEIAAHP